MIDPNLQAELRARFNPDGSELRRAQLRLLEMLKYIDGICEKYSLKYWLSSGSCLGAIRHGGFIPWDDDVDIEMPRSDYNKFIQIVNSRHDDFKVQYSGNDSDFDVPYAKLRDLKTLTHEDANKSKLFNGLFIDIFVMDYGTYFTRYLTCHLFYKMVICFSNDKRNIITNTLHDINLKIFNRLVFPLFRLLEQPFLNHHTLRHEMGMSFFKPRETYEIFPLQRIMFESIYVYVPGKADAYLTRIYGNYMTLPDIEEIKPHLSKVIFLD